MDSFNQQFLYSILIISLGYLLKRTNILKEKDGEGLARIIFNITLPALIIVTFSDIHFEMSLFLLIALGFVYGIFSGFIGLLVFKNERRKTKGMLGMMVPGFNIGLFAYPLVEGIWGQEGLVYFGMFDVGNALIVFGLCYLIGFFYSDEETELDVKNIVKKVSKSIPLMTYIIICGLNLTGISLPTMVFDVTGIISAANMPLSLLLLGIYLNFTFDKANMKLIIKLLTVRYLVGLIVGIPLFLLLPFGEMFKYTVLICLLLPTSMSNLPYAVELDYDRKFVGTVSNLTIVISFLIIWGIANIIM